jgi:TetR/AcrR family transcriptional regulator, fatty acid metabolism regulator protein
LSALTAFPARAARRPVSRLPRELRVAALMTAARAVFKEKGYADALTSEIAERAGVVEGTIYRYFASKRDLLLKVVEEWYAEMISDYDQQLGHIHGTRDRLRFMIWRHLTVIHQEPVLCRLVLLDLRADAAYRDTSVFLMNRQYTSRTVDIIEAGIGRGEFRSGVSATLVRDMIYGAIEHHTWAYLRGESDFSADAVADALTDMIYRALAVPQPAETGQGSLNEAVRRLEQIADRLAPAPETIRKPEGAANA